MKLLEALLVNSYAGDYRAIIEVITAFLRQNTDSQITLQNLADQKANIIATFGKPKLVINCHMDTVPPAAGWKTEPTRLCYGDGKVYGLGTADTKGNIYAVLKAAQAVNPKDIMLLFSVDEECDHNTGVDYFLGTDYKTGLQQAIVCEPTALHFINRHKGYYCFLVEVQATSAHSSQTSAQNAVVKAASLVTKFHRAGFNVGEIKGGRAGNIVPAFCQFKVSLRSYGAYPKVYQQVVAIAGKNKISALFCGAPLMNSSSVFAQENKAVEFWSEAALFQNAGIPAVVFGAGNIKQAHGNNEFVTLTELTQAQQQFESIMVGLK